MNTRAEVTPEALLGEIEDLIRLAPVYGGDMYAPTPENISWLGRFAAALELWNPAKGALIGLALSEFHTSHSMTSESGWRKIITLLHQARADLRMRTVGPLTIAVEKGRRFEYFDEIRKIAESARKELFFVDPYLDAEFVSNYLSHSPKNVAVRLLARERLASLVPAARLFAQQEGISISVRSAQGFHDRYLIVDGSACYQSGASFKDGGKTAPTTLTEITDAFAAVQKTYEELWVQAKLEL